MARGSGTRERILAAARVVMLDVGLIRATTREIARAAGVSEGTLYNHFANKEALFLCALSELPSGFFAVIGGLRDRAGSETVLAVLEDVARAALPFYAEAIPMGASIFADPGLLIRHRDLLRERGAGPHRANEAVAAFLRAEQTLGRVRRDADPEAAAYMLLGALHQYVYWQQFLGASATTEEDERFLSGLLENLERVLAPIPPPN